jgi:hypothetical protein
MIFLNDAACAGMNFYDAFMIYLSRFILFILYQFFWGWRGIRPVQYLSILHEFLLITYSMYITFYKLLVFVHSFALSRRNESFTKVDGKTLVYICALPPLNVSREDLSSAPPLHTYIISILPG